ncbi:Gfo/Idh/MocA family oxidoreductase [Candidatus Poribacteria bacterium]|nr:Gfo/Idh/MocA family oxidoreductase [Candidatus Poribacteria bacterium]
MATLKAGVIGTGFMGPAHVEGIRRCGLGEVIAIAGSSEKAAREKAAELGVDRAYGDFMELIQDPDVQVVHNCTPNNLHYVINRAVLTAGKHIISEKPLTVNLREAKLVMSAIERTNVVHAVMFNYRHYPMVAHLRAMVQAGELGKIYAIHGSYLQDWLLYETDYNWRVDAELGGPSRVVADIGSHWLDLAQFITGRKITEVVADFRTFLPVRKKSVTTVGTFGRAITPHLVDVRVSTEDYASALLRFEDDMPGVVTLSQVSAGRKNRLYFQIDGSLRSAAWDQEEPEALWFGYRDRQNERMVKEKPAQKQEARRQVQYPPGHDAAWEDGIKNFMSEVYQCIGKGKRAARDTVGFATFADGYRAVMLVDKIFTSNRQKHWTKCDV